MTSISQQKSITMEENQVDGLQLADNALARAKLQLQYEFQNNFSTMSPDLKTLSAYNPAIADPAYGQPHNTNQTASTEYAWRTYVDSLSGFNQTFTTNVDVRLLEKNTSSTTYQYYIFAIQAQSPGMDTNGDNVPDEGLRRLEEVVRIDLVFVNNPLVASGRGAIVAFGPVTVSGNFKVDGRDYSADNSSISAGTGAPGISCTSTVTMQSGSVTVGGTSGGTDYAPANKSTAVDPTYFDQSTTYWGTTQPDGPDKYFGLSHGDLKASAQASGTYFTSAAAYNSYISSNPNPSGKILYLEVPNGTSVGQLDVPVNPAPTYEPSIIVVTGTDTTNHNVTVGPVHCNNGVFQGVLVADRIDKLNGNGGVVGQIVSFNDANLGDTIGNGTFDVHFSNAVLGNLPFMTQSATPTSTTPIDLHIWHEIPIEAP